MGGSVQSCPIIENDQENREEEFTSFCTLAGGQFFFVQREHWERKLQNQDLCRPLPRIDKGYQLFLNNGKATLVRMSVNELRQICRAYDVEIFDEIPSKIAFHENNYWAFHIIAFEANKSVTPSSPDRLETDSEAAAKVTNIPRLAWLKTLWRGKSNVEKSSYDQYDTGDPVYMGNNDDEDREEEEEQRVRSESQGSNHSASPNWPARDPATPRFTQPLSSSSYDDVQSRAEITPSQPEKSPDILASPIPAPVIITRADKPPTWTKRLDELGEDVESGTSSCSDDELLTRSMQRCTSKRPREKISDVPSAWANFELGLSSPEKPKPTTPGREKRTPMTRSQIRNAIRSSPPKQASKRMKKATPRNKTPLKSAQRHKKRVSTDEE